MQLCGGNGVLMHVIAGSHSGLDPQSLIDKTRKL